MKDDDTTRQELDRASQTPRVIRPHKHIRALSPRRLAKFVVLKHVVVVAIGLMMGQRWVALPRHFVMILFGKTP
jgi:hypothetical protein